MSVLERYSKRIRPSKMRQQDVARRLAVAVIAIGVGITILGATGNGYVDYQLKLVERWKHRLVFCTAGQTYRTGEKRISGTYISDVADPGGKMTIAQLRRRIGSTERWVVIWRPRFIGMMVSGGLIALGGLSLFFGMPLFWGRKGTGQTLAAGGEGEFKNWASQFGGPDTQPDNEQSCADQQS